jgi:hypothetical protein
MEILHRGTLPEERQYEATCTRCYTKFRFAQHEASMSSDQRDGNALRIDCPVCRNTVWVDPRRNNGVASGGVGFGYNSGMAGH